VAFGEHASTIAVRPIVFSRIFSPCLLCFASP